MMEPDTENLTVVESAIAKERRLTAMHLQEIERNLLDAEDRAMFEMFEREGWSHERCLAYIKAHTKGVTGPTR